MARLQALLRNRNVIFLLALTSGLLVPFAVPVSRHLVLPALAWAITLSILKVGKDSFRNPRSLLFFALLGIIMNYIIMGNVLIGLATLIIHDEAIWTGFVLLAAVPPAIAVIPFSTILKGNIQISLFGTLGAHLGGLAIMPLIILILLSTSDVDPLKLLLAAGQLIVLPLILSRLFIWNRWKARIEPYRGTMTNWNFFFVLSTMVMICYILWLDFKKHRDW